MNRKYDHLVKWFRSKLETKTFLAGLKVHYFELLDLVVKTKSFQTYDHHFINDVHRFLCEIGMAKTRVPLFMIRSEKYDFGGAL